MNINSERLNALAVKMLESVNTGSRTFTPRNFQIAAEVLRIGLKELDVIETKTSGDNQLLIAYSKEIYGESSHCGAITVQELIESNRNLIKELNAGQRKEWRDALDQAREEAANRTLDCTYVKIDQLRGMTLVQLAELIGVSPDDVRRSVEHEIENADSCDTAVWCDTIVDRDALTLTKDSVISVVDATGDESVSDGGAVYFFNAGDASFVKVAEMKYTKHAMTILRK